jgi:septal ring factor EnvC (AmiA/AmiB activator)
MSTKITHEYMIVQQAAICLFEPLRTYLPEVATSAFQALDAGRAPKMAGQVLVASLRAYIDTIEAKHVEMEKHTYKRIQELENERREHIEKESDYQKKVKDLEDEIQLLKKQTSTLQETIKSQNRILAEQHKKLISYYGS